MSIIKHKHINHVTKYKIPKIKNKNSSFNINKSTNRYKVNKSKNNSFGINKSIKYDNRNINDIMDRRYIVISVFMILSFLIIGIRLFKLQILEYDDYRDFLVVATEKTVEGSSAPRGRIYDRNYRLLVDNQAKKTIYYKKENGVKKKDEIELAYKIADIIDLDYSKLSDYRLKIFYCDNNMDLCRSKITFEEWNKYKERKLNDIQIEKLMFERISKEELDKYSDIDRKSAYIYYLMNRGYSYQEKIIKNKDVTESEYAIISENIASLHGFNTKIDWDRIYLYGDTFKSILGTVSSDTQGIPKELASSYLEKGYSLDDRVGTSYLELQYEDYLKGTKPLYRINGNNLELISQGRRGNDIVLTIDIELQKYLEEVLAYEVMNAKWEANTKYFNRSFAVISNPNTGEILAMGGKQVKTDDNGNLKIIDYTPGVVTLPVTPGSIVKGASMLVGYKYGAIDIGSIQRDECIKIQATPLKCSWRTMGDIDDLYALRYSSNVYQYKIAIKVGGGNYVYNEPLKINPDAFLKYREMYASFGLGVKTGIDLPVESLGYMGKSELPGHLMDYSIGQYDTYTPIQLSQYINTLANGGVKYRPYLLKEVYAPSVNKDEILGDLVYASSKEKMGSVDIDKKYIDRVKEGFHQVITNGIGGGYMGNYYNTAGKTGTSQSFIDTDLDGVVDTETISSSFVGYAPYDNPTMSIIVVSPDISLPDSGYQSMITKRISAKMVNKYFEIY